MTGTDAFFDTNVLLYAISSDSAKAQISEKLIGIGGVVSIQVLAEFVDVARRKHALTWSRRRDVLANVEELCVVEGLTLETHQRAVAISERYGYRIFDGMIIAAATMANCSTLLSEDMRAGQSIGRLTIRNPFSGT